MTPEERAALEALRFDWAPTADDVWKAPPFHVVGLHHAVESTIMEGFADATASRDASPIGVVVQGQRGAGKTHLISRVRERVQADGGYFFLLTLLTAEDFSLSVATSIVEGLSRPAPEGEDQLRTVLRKIGTAVHASRATRRAIAGETELTPRALDEFTSQLRRFDSMLGRECGETARALAMLAADDPAAHTIGDSFLASLPDEEGERRPWRLRSAARPAELIVRDLSWLIAATGPAVIAVDQIDTLIRQSTHGMRSDSADGGAADLLLDQVAHGLMELRQRTRRTLTVVACLPDTWQSIRKRATDTVPDRFRQATQLMTIPTPGIAAELVTKRFADRFARVPFTPDYSTWPVRSEALADAPGYTPRQLLIEIDSHVRACVADGAVRELRRLGPPPRVEPPAPTVEVPTATAEQLDHLDKRFRELQADADIVMPFLRDEENKAVSALLTAGLTAWIIERAAASHLFALSPPFGPAAPLHARLHRILDEATEDQVHWAFRAIAPAHGNAELNRLRKAIVASGLTEGVPKRKLFILRNEERWSQGRQTQLERARLERARGRQVKLSARDVRTLSALADLLAEDPPGLRPWLISRQKASDTDLFQETLADADGDLATPPPQPSGPVQDAHGPPATAGGPPTPARGQPRPRPPAAGEEASGADAMPVGIDLVDGAQVGIVLPALRKHVVVFAGSGSGKTVLLRRLVEECALRAVSAIVLDPNNDLARLGDRWPAPPAGWGPGDEQRAADYHATAEVMIWTPRRAAGRPLTFQPLPDFRAVRDDPDEFSAAVDAAVAALAPRAKLDGRTARMEVSQAVLRNAVEHFGRRGGSRLHDLIALLRDLPDEASTLDGASKVAAGLAQVLEAAAVNDPLFGGAGAPCDPGDLLRPSPPKRARISVISFIGLESDEQRQSFVNQLQMALFAWIKKHPATDRPLGGLFVMDEAQTLAPSGAMTACTQSTLALASQARKYGLGLVFATQAPKALHNRIPGNAVTQFFGLLNAPVQIAAAKEMAVSKGGSVPDISVLSAGQFYLAGEGQPFRKLRAPMCLSYHPPSPLTTDEVLARVRTTVRPSRPGQEV
jgi:Helicase HerA, central domain